MGHAGRKQFMHLLTFIQFLEFFVVPVISLFLGMIHAALPKEISRLCALSEKNKLFRPWVISCTIVYPCCIFCCVFPFLLCNISLLLDISGIKCFFKIASTLANRLVRSMVFIAVGIS